MMASKVREFRDVYVHGKVIGRGKFSVVRECRHKYSRSVYASKTLLLSETEGNSMPAIRNEINTMKRLKHANILPLVDVFYSTTQVIVVTELSKIGDLYEFIMNQVQINETLSRLFAFQIASAIDYMHSLNMVHRDLKPENCLIFKDCSSDSFLLKLCDFGLTETVTIIGLTEVCGSPSLVAPEILERKSYGLSVDIWSMGILFYFMLCRYFPFAHDKLSVQFRMIVDGTFEFPPSDWSTISSNAKELLLSMIVKNPKKRIKATDVLHSEWFQSDSTPPRLKKMTLKTAGTIITAARKFSSTDPKMKRENAILSEKLINQVLYGET